MPRRAHKPEHRHYLLPLDVPEDLDDWAAWGTVCVPVPVPLIQYLPNILRPYRWRERWIGTSDQKALMSGIWEDLITRFINADPCAETGEMFKLRQNPSNSCQLQQSLDGGITWTLAFDYSLCRSPILNFQMGLELTQIFQQWSDAPDLPGINPNAPTETFSSSSGDNSERLNARKLALCYACNVYVDLYCETIKEINQDASSAGNIVNLALGVVVALGTAGAVFSFGTSTLLAMAVAGAVGSLGLAAYSSLTDAVLEDTVAREAVACLMYRTLRPLEPTPENFASAVNSGTLTGNAELIRATLANDISNEAGLENQFNAFINALGEALRPAELGLVDACPCNDVTVQIFSEFARTTLKDSIGADYGVPFDVEYDPATWGTNEFFAVWGEYVEYSYEVIEGSYTTTVGESAYAYIEESNSVVASGAATIATDLPNPGTARGIFMNPNEFDSNPHTVRITLGAP